MFIFETKSLESIGAHLKVNENDYYKFRNLHTHLSFSDSKRKKIQPA